MISSLKEAKKQQKKRRNLHLVMFYLEYLIYVMVLGGRAGNSIDLGPKNQRMILLTVDYTRFQFHQKKEEVCCV